MSDNRNGDTGPQNLRNAMRVMRGEVHRMEKVSRRRRKQGYCASPRQYCDICAKVFDIAVVDPNAQITASRCVDCKRLLAEGYTAVITSENYAFIKADHLTENGLAGKVVPVTAETFEKLKAKHVPKQEPPQSA